MTDPAETIAASIAANLAGVRRRVAEAASASGRDVNSIRLIAVSKTHPAQAVETVIAAGQLCFGENRVQEALAKFPGLKARHTKIELHLIGPLQTNKAREAVGLFDVIQSLDREKLARALKAEMEKQGRRPSLFVQVNTGAEAQKAGVAPRQADDFIRLCRADLALPVLGLMCIPPLDQDPAPHFAQLAEIARRNGLTLLSMGMSADFETAIRLGATHIRIGTAIFGLR
jgi:PLP dependent protein